MKRILLVSLLALCACKRQPSGYLTTEIVTNTGYNFKMGFVTMTDGTSQQVLTGRTAQTTYTLKTFTNYTREGKLITVPLSEKVLSNSEVSWNPPGLPPVVGQ